MQYWLFVISALLCALNVYLGVMTGSAWSWAAAVFIGLLTLRQLDTLIRYR